MSRISEVIITSGIPGSGKSTWIRNNTNPYMTEVFSADTYFLSSLGQYRFNQAMLSEAHSSCLKSYTERLLHLCNDHDDSMQITLVVDNTNTSAWEIAPYYSLAQAFGIPVKVVRIIASPETAYRRNIHGVEREKIQKMAERLARNPLPSFWNVVEVTAGK
jgi:predicted kinase